MRFRRRAALLSLLLSGYVWATCPVKTDFDNCLGEARRTNQNAPCDKSVDPACFERLVCDACAARSMKPSKYRPQLQPAYFAHCQKAGMTNKTTEILTTIKESFDDCRLP